MKITKLVTKKEVWSLAAISQVVFMRPALAIAPKTAEDVATILGKIARDLATIFAALATVILIYSAFLYLTGGGNPTRLETAKKTLVWAIIAIALSAVAFGIPQIIKVLICGPGGNC